MSGPRPIVVADQTGQLARCLMQEARRRATALVAVRRTPLPGWRLRPLEARRRSRRCRRLVSNGKRKLWKRTSRRCEGSGFSGTCETRKDGLDPRGKMDSRASVSPIVLAWTDPDVRTGETGHRIPASVLSLAGSGRINRPNLQTVRLASLIELGLMDYLRRRGGAFARAAAATPSKIPTMLSRRWGGFAGIALNPLRRRMAPLRPSIRIASDTSARSLGSIA